MSVRAYDPDFARRLDEFGELLLTCREVTRALVIETQWRPAEGSPAAQDAEALAKREPPTPVVIPTVLYIYVTTAGEHLGGLGALYERHEVVYPPGPLLRAAVEHCARALWVVQRDGVPVEDRLARAFLEVLLSAEQAKRTAKHLEGKMSDLYRQERERFAGTRRMAEQVFGESILDEDGRHRIRGQHLPSPEECVGWMFGFLGQPLTDEAAVGIYDFLSNLSHPTLYPHMQMWEQPQRPGLTIDDHERRVRSAVAPFYNVLNMMISYNGWSSVCIDELRATVDRFMPDLLED
ncbi:MAG TPA: hypothetical protein VIJ39_06385 [Solirubrobacteraceae bacterium]